MRRVRDRELERERKVDHACERMGDDDMIGQALRRDRLRHRESQRAYAERRGFSDSQLARLESRAGDMALGTVLAALAETAYGLAIVPLGPRPTLSLNPISCEGREIASAVRQTVDGHASMRSAAERLGVPRTTLSRATDDPKQLSLKAVRSVLRQCGYGLVVAHADTGLVVHARDWDGGEVAARARGGGRRLAGHRLPMATPLGPSWWWERWSHVIGMEPPLWTTINADRPPSHQYRHAAHWLDHL
ncbi:helix-turn-helix domain-containing protein [Knoellia remsis]|nr:helix-turn-helix domain-containing protein [Knoellia remsis]